MTSDEEIAKLDPQTVTSLTYAFKRTIEFCKGRGAMLRSLLAPSQPAARYCPRCDAVTERRPNGRCAPCQTKYTREYMRTWRPPASWLDA